MTCRAGVLPYTSSLFPAGLGTVIDTKSHRFSRVMKTQTSADPSPLSLLSVLSNYFMNSLNVAPGHFSCSRGLSHSVRCPSSPRHHPQPVPFANVQEFKDVTQQLCLYDWRQKKRPLTHDGTAAPTTGPIYSFRGWGWLHAWHQYPSPPTVPLPPPRGAWVWLQAKAQHCSPVQAKEISGPDALYKHQMVMIKIKLN